MVRSWLKCLTYFEKGVGLEIINAGLLANIEPAEEDGATVQLAPLTHQHTSKSDLDGLFKAVG